MNSGASWFDDILPFVSKTVSKISISEKKASLVLNK